MLMESFKRLKDLNVLPIKLENKFGCKEVDSIHRKINDIIYFFNFFFITEGARTFLLNTIKECGTELNSINESLAKASSSRKKELREKLLNYYNIILHYSPPSSNDINVITSVEKMNKMVVAQYLKDKKDGMDEEKIFKWLRKIKWFSNAYQTTDGLKSVNNELLANFKL